MKEIKELFGKTEIAEIKEILEKVIQKIEKENREKQNELLEEVVKEAKKADEKLKKDYKVIEGLYYFPERIAPLALLAEEITADSDIEKDMLKVLKLNLNNYFKQFKKTEEGDYHMPTEDIQQTLEILEEECKYFSALRKRGTRISIFSFNARSRLIGIGTLNYNKIENKTFGIQSYYTEEPPKKESMEILLEQFGIILREVILGGSGNAPEDFLEIFEGIEMKEIDEESKEMTVLFANSFAHYIIEKMEIRVTEKYGPNWKEQSGTRNEEFVKRLMKYFDKIFEDLLKENEEWDDNEKCPCGSGKRYKNCCKKKKIKYLKSENENEYIKSIPMHPEVEKALKSEAIRFKELFGRMPGGNDFTLGGVLLKDLNREKKLMKREGILDNAYLYASNITGLMLTEENEDLLPERDVNEFAKYMEEYEKLMKSRIKGNQANIVQVVEGTSYMLEVLINKKLEDMIYVLNLFVNFYSQNNPQKENFVIKDIKDFLVFCSYKTSVNLKALRELVNSEYYDNSMAVVRFIFEILINIKAYKNNKELFEMKILPLSGIELGTHRKVEGKSEIEEIKTGRRFKYDIQKRQLAEKAGENYKKLYDTFYRELSEFIHLDAVAAKRIFQDNDMFLELDECLVAGFIGMCLSLEVIMELIEFEGNNKKMSNDLKYFSNILIKDFIPVLEEITIIDDREAYHILEDTLKEYKPDYKINYQRKKKYEVY